MGLPRVLLIEGGGGVPIETSLHLSVPIASTRCPLDSRLSPSSAVEGLLTPGIKVGIQLGKEEGWGARG